MTDVLAPPTFLVAPPRASEAGRCARRIDPRGEKAPWMALAFQSAHMDERRPAILVASRSDRRDILELVGQTRRDDDWLHLSADQWGEFFDYADGAIVVGHTLNQIIAPAIREDLRRVANRGGRGLARRWESLSERADLLEAMRFLRDTVAPWAGSDGAVADDPRLAYARATGRELLARLAAIEYLSLSDAAAILTPGLVHPDEASGTERKMRATAAIWARIAPAMAIFADPSVVAPVRAADEVAAAVEASSHPGDTLDWTDAIFLAPAVAAVADAERLGVTPATASFLAARGLADPDKLAELRRLDPDEHSHNPFLLKDMGPSADRLRRAISQHEPITIFGDYDADGIPGTALLATWLRHAGADVRTLIARREHGYGLLPEAAEQIIGEHAPSLVITIDCGTSNHDSIRYLQTVGRADVIVLDHHLALEGNPPTPYFVNPMRADGETYPFRYLCGCGVAYKMVQALSARRHEPGLYDLLALSTVADQMPIIGENRFYVTAAVEQARRTGQGNLGLQHLASAAGHPLGGLTPEDMGFVFGPRINAVGRMGRDPNDVVELLASNDPEKAARMAAEMEALNKDRREVTDELIERALEIIGPDPDDFVVAYLPDMFVGVSGLIASRLVQETGRPVLVVNEHGRGSGRAPAGGTIIDYVEQLKQHPKLHDLSYGGHAAACGFQNADPRALVQAARSVKIDQLDRRERPRACDATITLGDLTQALAQELDELAPYLAGQLAPALRISDVRITGVRRTGSNRDSNHLRIDLEDDKGDTARALWFGAASHEQDLPERVDLLGRPSLSMYGRDTTVMFLIDRLVPAAGHAGAPDTF